MKNTQFLACTICTLLILLLLTACEKPPVEVIDDPLLKDQYFIFSIGGLQGFAAVPTDTVDARKVGNATYLTGIKADGQTRISASFDGASAGTYSFNNLRLLVNSRYYVPTTIAPQVFVSVYGNTGEMVNGSYNGQLKDSLSGVTYTVNGLFKIRRAL